MPKERETGKDDIGSALVDLVHAGQAVRRATRVRLISEAKTALQTAGKVADALGDL